MPQYWIYLIKRECMIIFLSKSMEHKVKSYKQ